MKTAKRFAALTILLALTLNSSACLFGKKVTTSPATRIANTYSFLLGTIEIVNELRRVGEMSPEGYEKFRTIALNINASLDITSTFIQQGKTDSAIGEVKRIISLIRELNSQAVFTSSPNIRNHIIQFLSLGEIWADNLRILLGKSKEKEASLKEFSKLSSPATRGNNLTLTVMISSIITGVLIRISNQNSLSPEAAWSEGRLLNSEIKTLLTSP